MLDKKYYCFHLEIMFIALPSIGIIYSDFHYFIDIYNKYAYILFKENNLFQNYIYLKI
jgi:hypothetical protein